MASFTPLNKRPTAKIVQLSNLEVLPKLEPLPPFGQGSKVGASGISAADVPAMKRSFDLLKGLSMVSSAEPTDGRRSSQLRTIALGIYIAGLAANQHTVLTVIWSRSRSPKLLSSLF